MTHRLNLFLLILLAAVGLPLYLLLFDSETDARPAKPLEITELRRLAAAVPGRAPHAVQMEIVASRGLPQTVLAAGTGFRWVNMPVLSYRLPVPGGMPIVIDTGLSKAQADDLGMTWYNPRAQRRVERALDEAGLILVTDEQPEHIGGLATYRDGAKVRPKALLNPAQARSGALARGAAPPARLAAQGVQPVAPGVVVIPAPSRAPGSQMIYVRLEDGRELLFTGDIATLAVSWQAVRPRARLLSDHLAPSDRNEVAAWLRAISRLHRQAPDMIIVPGHDARPLAVALRPKPS